MTLNKIQNVDQHLKFSLIWTIKIPTEWKFNLQRASLLCYETMTKRGNF